MTTYTDIPLTSRVWIYQTNRELTNEEVLNINTRSVAFVDQWTSHNQLMKACVKILYNRFLVLLVDEDTAPASGCGIDKAVHFVQQLEKEFSIVLLDRMQVAYKLGEKLFACSLADFENKIQSGAVGEDTIVFNNLINTKAELEEAWETPLKKSWHSRMLVS